MMTVKSPTCIRILSLVRENPRTFSELKEFLSDGKEYSDELLIYYIDLLMKTCMLSTKKFDDVEKYIITHSGIYRYNFFDID